MQELFKIEQRKGQQVVDGRELHAFLESKKDFSDWIKHRIEKYGLVENWDFTTFQGKSSGGRPTVEYAITLDAAKELAMVEGNTKGKQARLWFIEKEKELSEIKSTPAKHSNPSLAIARQLLEAMEAQEERITKVEEHAKLIEAKIDTIDTNFISVIGFARVNGISLPNNEALRMGKRAGKLSREMGFTIGKVFDAKYGSVNTYHKDVLQTVFQNSTAR